VGAQYADVVLPGATYTEKAGTYVNTEGRSQVTRAATSLPGAARDDWKIIRAVSEYLGRPLAYDNIASMRARMEEVCPSLVSYDVLERPSAAIMGLGLRAGLVDRNKGAKAAGTPLKQVIEDFYLTDCISRKYGFNSTLRYF